MKSKRSPDSVVSGVQVCLCRDQRYVCVKDRMRATSLELLQKRFDSPLSGDWCPQK